MSLRWPEKARLRLEDMSGGGVECAGVWGPRFGNNRGSTPLRIPRGSGGRHSESGRQLVACILRLNGRPLAALDAAACVAPAEATARGEGAPSREAHDAQRGEGGGGASAARPQAAPVGAEGQAPAEGA